MKNELILITKIFGSDIKRKGLLLLIIMAIISKIVVVNKLESEVINFLSFGGSDLFYSVLIIPGFLAWSLPLILKIESCLKKHCYVRFVYFRILILLNFILATLFAFAASLVLYVTVLLEMKGEFSIEDFTLVLIWIATLAFYLLILDLLFSVVMQITDKVWVPLIAVIILVCIDQGTIFMYGVSLFFGKLVSLKNVNIYLSGNWTVTGSIFLGTVLVLGVGLLILIFNRDWVTGGAEEDVFV